VMVPDGMFAIPEKCLDDPEFADIKETLVQYHKEGKVQDITDLNEKNLTTVVQKDKYYLSKEYWVVKALTTETLSISTVDKLTDLPTKFLIRPDIASAVDAEKDASKETEEPKSKGLFGMDQNFARAMMESETKPKGFLSKLWVWIKKIWKSIFD